MNPVAISRPIQAVLENYRCEMPEPGTTFGTPFPVEHVEAQIEILKKCLVPPRLQQFLLMETFAESNSPRETSMWLVAEREAHGNRYLIWYDAARGCFGLAEKRRGTPLPVSFLTGDLVGVFCAI